MARLRFWIVLALFASGVAGPILHGELSEEEKRKRAAFLKAREEMRTVSSPTPSPHRKPKPKAAKHPPKKKRSPPSPKPKKRPSRRRHRKDLKRNQRKLPSPKKRQDQNRKPLLNANHRRHARVPCPLHLANRRMLSCKNRDSRKRMFCRHRKNIASSFGNGPSRPGIIVIFRARCATKSIMPAFCGGAGNTSSCTTAARGRATRAFLIITIATSAT